MIGPFTTCVEGFLALHAHSCVGTRRVGCMRLLGGAVEIGCSALPTGFAVTQSGLRSFHLIW
jgi:hypothetical protein